MHLFLPFSLFSIRLASVGSTPTDSYVNLRGRLPLAPNRFAASRRADLS